MNLYKHLFFFFLLLVTHVSVEANKISVQQNGEINTIGHALEIANDGDSILVHQGIYKEGNLQITKSISLIGIDSPILDGENKYEILSIEANHVLVDGFVLKNVGVSQLKDNSALRIIKSRNCIIQNNIILNAFFGIYLEDSDSCKLIGNTITGQAVRESTSGNAIHAWNSEYAEIINNELSGHRDGIYLEFVENSLMKDNYSHSNLRYGLHFMFSNDNIYEGNNFSSNGAGVAVMYSKRIQMFGNTFERNEGAAAYGILLKDITDSKIERNIFQKNTIGIHAEGSNRLEIINNEFIRNGWAVKIMGSCEKLNFTGNNFISNTFEISTSSTRVSGHNFEKNYWSNYSGYDLDKDGIGDLPHRPVRLFSYLVEKVPTAIILIKSLFIDLLELAEKVTPSLTPANLMDEQPKMTKNNWND